MNETRHWREGAPSRVDPFQVRRCVDQQPSYGFHAPASDLDPFSDFIDTLKAALSSSDHLKD